MWVARESNGKTIWVWREEGPEWVKRLREQRERRGLVAARVDQQPSR